MATKKGLSNAIVLAALCAAMMILIFASSATASKTYYLDRTWVTAPDTCWWTSNAVNMPINIHWEQDHSYYFPGSSGDFTPGHYGWILNHPCFDEFNYNAEQSMYGFYTRIEFDPSVVQFVTVDSAGLIKEWGWPKPVVNFDNSAGWVEISAAYWEPSTIPTTETALCYVGFMVMGPPYADAMFDITEFRYNEIYQCDDPAWNHCNQWHGLQPIIIDCPHIGPLTVCKFLELSGLVTYCHNGYEMCDVEMKLEYMESSPAINDAFVSTNCEPDCGMNCAGKYMFTRIIGGYDYCVSAFYTDDERDAIDAFDAALLLSHLVGIFDLDPFCCKIMAADVSGSCDLSPLDASLILQKSVGLIPYFPKTEAKLTNWIFVPAWHMEEPDPCICPPEEWCFDPLADDQIDIDFYGVLLGDVSGNWGLSIPKRYFGTGEVFTMESRLTGDDLVEVTIDIDFSDGAQSFQADIVFNSDEYSVVDVRSGSQIDEWMFVSNVVENTIKIAAASSEKAMATAEVAVVTLQPLGEADVRLDISNLTIDGASVVVEPASKNVGALPNGFVLDVNYPNPFNPETVIGYSIDKPVNVRIEVVNMLGQIVNTLVNEHQEAGSFTVTWHGDDQTGADVASGMYFYRMIAGDYAESKKMMLIR